MAKVLIADDEIPITDLLAELARDAGHEVLVAHNGQEALALARRERPILVISDIMMPLMSGYELLTALRADPDLRDTCVVLVSAASGPPPPPTPPADSYLTKPFDIGVMEDLIRQFTL
jgi:CheY-like chemotaxis protein